MMKKSLLLVVLALICTTLAAAPGPSSFDVSTVVQGINKMKLTTSQFTGSPGQFDDAVAYTGPLQVSTYGNQTFSAYLSTISNNRKGYKVSMGATAMASTESGQPTSYIDYTVTVNGQSLTTNGATGVGTVDVINVSSMAGVASQSHQISLSVDQASFEAAVEGMYTGTVTFTYTSNT